MPSPPQPNLTTALAAIWQRNQPQVLERLALLDQAAATNPLPAALQQEASATAHKLAGTLGMFGFTQGTDIARKLEQLLDQPNPAPATLNELTQDLRRAVFP